MKHVKKHQELALNLYQSGNSDAMYLAGLCVNPKTDDKGACREWVEQANWYVISEYTVAQ